MKTVDREDETRREIARETDRIRREMERERRAKSMSPARDRSPTRTYLSLTTPKSIYDKGDSPRIAGGGVNTGEKSLSDEEKERTAELKATQNALDVTQSALFEARKGLKDTQAQYEDARTQLMLSEYKRENTTKELARLSDELRRKKDMAKTLDTQASQRREEMKQFDAIGFTKDEAVQIIEENERMKGRLRNMDAVHAERDELIQQLETTKQELFNEQKRARAHIEELKEELENITSTCEQTQSEKDEVTKRLQKLESGFKKMEKEKNELIQEKTRQYEEERDKHRKDKSDWRQRNLDEVETLRQDIIRVTNKCGALQEEVRAKDDINHQLRDEVLELQQKQEQESMSRSTILDEHKKTLQTLRKETDTAMVQLRESLFLEKQKTVDQMREELEQERRDISSRSEERYENQVTELEAIIKAKSEEISHLSKLVNKLESDVTRTRVRKDDEIKQQVQEAVNSARRTLEDEKDWAVQQERDTLQREHRQTLKKLQEELTRMQGEQRGFEARMKEQRIELEDLKTSNKTMMHEKLVAVARAKELMRQEHTVELERIKEQMKNEHKMEIDKLRDTIRIQEGELRQHREDRMKFVRQSKESNISLDRTERTLINEINEECRKTSEVLGLNPRKVNFSSSIGASTTGKSPTTSALANLRACNEELRMHVTDLQSELELQRNSVNMADRQKDDALVNLRRQLTREKEEEMARLKERLVRVGPSGLSTNEYRSMMYTPDNDVAARQQQYEYKTYPNERSLRQMSEQQQNDLERLEREINKLAMTDGHGTPDDIAYAKELGQLQSKVKQLQSENNSLRRAKLNSMSSVSNPDLTRPDMYTSPSHRKFTMRSPSPTRDQQRMASAIELRMKEHDYETETLTDHQRRNRDIMSRKMADMSKLQNTLTNQAKELIQLEKAYTQLNKYSKAPRPHSALR